MTEPGKVKILVVDDLPEKLLVYQSILEELDEELVLARSGTEALKLALKHDFAVSPDVTCRMSTALKPRR